MLFQKPGLSIPRGDFWGLDSGSYEGLASFSFVRKIEFQQRKNISNQNLTYPDILLYFQGLYFILSIYFTTYYISIYIFYPIIHQVYIISCHVMLYLHFMSYQTQLTLILFFLNSILRGNKICVSITRRKHRKTHDIIITYDILSSTIKINLCSGHITKGTIFIRLKGKSSQNISKVHMNDLTDVSLFPKFWLSNQFS